MMKFLGYFGNKAHEDITTTLPELVECSKTSIQLSDGKEFHLWHHPDCYVNEGEKLVVLVNGDIYNDRSLLVDIFKSKCDNLKGISEALSALHGHFSVFLLNKITGCSYIATDRIGTHPVYYAQNNNEWLVSDKIDSIINAAPQLKVLSRQGIYQYVFFHCIPAPDTIYEHVKKLKACELLELSNNPESQTWFVPDFSQLNKSTADTKKQLMDALSSGVSNSLINQNIERTGAFLSGGLDSSTVSGFFAKKAGKGKAKTFTIGFDAKGYDESAFAKITADHFQTDHRVYYVTPDDIQDALHKIAKHYGEPFGNSSALPAYYCARYAKSLGVDTLLAGDGGDELYAGNERYAKQKVFEWYFKIPAPIRKLFIEFPLAKLPADKIPVVKKAASYIRQANTRLPGRLHAYNFLHQFNPKDVFEDSFLSQVNSERPMQLLNERFHEPKNGDSQNRMLYLDWKFTLADNDLVKVTNMCELAGVDVKYPMLDDELVLLSTRIPSETLLPGNKLRHFYKEATRGFLSDKTLNKSKKGFGLPFGVWLKERPELREMAYNNVRKLTQYGFFKASFLEHAIKMHSSDHPGYFGELIWILMMLNMWLEEH